MTDTDQDLAIRARAGRREAFDALVARHGPGLLRFLRRLTRRPEDAQDLFQETFLRAYRSLGTLRDPARFRAWVVTIATNAVRRQIERRGEPERSLELEPEPEGDSGMTALRNLEQAERRTALRQAMRRLPDRQKAVLSMRLDMNLPFAEIGEALGIREENARAHHYQALRSLRRMLAHLALPTAPRHGDST